MRPRTKADDRAKADLINILSSLTIVLEKIHDAQTRHGIDVGGGTPSPRTFMINQVEKYVKLAVAITKKAIGQPK